VLPPFGRATALQTTKNHQNTIYPSLTTEFLPVTRITMRRPPSAAPLEVVILVTGRKSHGLTAVARPPCVPGSSRPAQGKQRDARSARRLGLHTAVSRLGTYIIAHSPVLYDILANSPMTLRLSEDSPTLSDTSLFTQLKCPRPRRPYVPVADASAPQRERKAVSTAAKLDAPRLQPAARLSDSTFHRDPWLD
jgi:hypothetical protein